MGPLRSAIVIAQGFDASFVGAETYNRSNAHGPLLAVDETLPK